jgi:hypothetical protein
MYVSITNAIHKEFGLRLVSEDDVPQKFPLLVVLTMPAPEMIDASAWIATAEAEIAQAMIAVWGRNESFPVGGDLSL